jgi:tetratricopeptide (TPR) repeat protein
VEDLRQHANPDDLLRDFEEAGNPWPGHPRREATMVLDLVEPALHSRRKETREAAFKTIDRFRRLIQHPLEPDVFERYWYFGLLAMFEGMLTPNIAELYVDAALQRFPDEPRFLLSRAIVTDQRWSTRREPTSSGDRPSAAHTARVRSQYEAAIAFPEAAVEARVRLAFFLHRIGEHKEAMAHLTAAGKTTIPEPSLRYVYLLILGHVLWSLDRQEEAQDAYRAAQTVFPTAPSPRVALMNTLLLRGDRQAAEALAAKIQTDTNDDLDPWWMYWLGQYRLHPAVMARLREMSQ